MPDGMPPALLVERFDIRDSVKDTRLLALEDLCSVLDLPTEAKYDGTMERVARAVRPLSTAPEEDLIIILRRTLFAWLIADGDMHLKNMALLKIAEPGDERFGSVRMAPLYDAVTTRVFPRLERDSYERGLRDHEPGCPAKRERKPLHDRQGFEPLVPAGFRMCVKGFPVLGDSVPLASRYMGALI